MSEVLDIKWEVKPVNPFRGGPKDTQFTESSTALYWVKDKWYKGAPWHCYVLDLTGYIYRGAYLTPCNDLEEILNLELFEK